MSVKTLAVVSLLCGPVACSDGTGPEGIGPIPDAVVVVPSMDALVPGDVVQLRAAVLDADGGVIPGLAEFTWSTSDAAIATVDSAGLIEALAVGPVTIRASYEELTGSAAIEVDWLRLDWIGTGGRHSCGLTTAGTVYCWGANSNGQLGTGDREPRSAPTRLLGNMAFNALSVGNWHTCGITPGGSAYCWGSNTDGQLGGDSDLDSAAPVQVQLDAAIASVRAGGLHTCALAVTGETYCWGDNSYGQLGGGGSSHAEAVPVRVLGGHTFDALTSGGLHTCGLTSEGTAFCWGYNGLGQLGIGSHDSGTHGEPVGVAGGLTLESLEASGSNSCGIGADGTAYCWGSDNTGQLGDGPDDRTCMIGEFEHDCSSAPVEVAVGFTFASLAPAVGIAGGSFACGVSTDDAAYCWGLNHFGNLGNGTTQPSDSPAPVSGGIEFVSVSGGGEHACGIAVDGYTYCWGANDEGRLGDDSTTDRSFPVRIARQGG